MGPTETTRWQHQPLNGNTASSAAATWVSPNVAATSASRPPAISAVRLNTATTETASCTASVTGAACLATAVTLPRSTASMRASACHAAWLIAVGSAPPPRLSKRSKTRLAGNQGFAVPTGKSQRDNPPNKPQARRQTLRPSKPKLRSKTFSSNLVFNIYKCTQRRASATIVKNYVLRSAFIGRARDILTTPYDQVFMNHPFINTPHFVV